MSHFAALIGNLELTLCAQQLISDRGSAIPVWCDKC